MLKYVAACLLVVGAVSGAKLGKNIKNGCNMTYLVEAPLCCSTLPKVFGKSEWEECAGTGKPKGPPPCIVECMLKNVGALNDKVIDYTKLSDLFKNNATTEEWKTIVGTAFDTCKKLVEDLASKMPKGLKKGKGKKCEPDSAVLLTCIQSELFVNCPSADVNSTVTEGVKPCADRITEIKACDKTAPSLPGKGQRGGLKKKQQKNKG
ncbi:Hypothetical predicted protein [Cloeon dipterum]|uniref:OBP47-like domain-containing protein n=1 Tax=Cloeon dipterum TaxID=197152 RepID=A0A8S1CPW8_9INSE|nr:Hypothetical predicted protein [Cloeon dipterum]